MSSVLKELGGRRRQVVIFQEGSPRANVPQRKTPLGAQPEMAVPHLQKLFVAEGDQRVDAGGAAGWDPAGYDTSDQEQGGYRAQRDWVVGGDAPELRGDDAGYREAGDNAEGDA